MTIGFGSNRKVTRFKPALPSHLYRTYRTSSPIETHYRLATCEEVQCSAYMEGWTYKKVDLGERLLHIVTHAGKRYREQALGDDIYLVFEPGQACFQASTHRVSLERPSFYYTGRGDYRTFSTRNAQRLNGEDWADSFANHMDALNSKYQEG